MHAWCLRGETAADGAAPAAGKVDRGVQAQPAVSLTSVKYAENVSGAIYSADVDEEENDEDDKRCTIFCWSSCAGSTAFSFGNSNAIRTEPYGKFTR
jgi:hypothetical protein